jgi:hypothetical protein
MKGKGERSHHRYKLLKNEVRQHAHLVFMSKEQSSQKEKKQHFDLIAIN